MWIEFRYCRSKMITMQNKTIVYNDRVVRQFVGASVMWGIVGMLVGVIVASQLAFWQLNLPPYLSFGRLRPLHTNAVIFAFVGNMIFAGIYYSSQRLLKQRMGSDLLSQIHFWGWQLIIVSAALTLPLGITQGKEYAELEWPIDILITLVWVVFAINFFWTVAKRNEKNLYVALWFYIATIITVAVLHIVNNLCIPLAAFHSYSLFGGVQDALVQWWYGHNAVAFFLTTPVLGIMYYFMPKVIGKPVYSYRLSIIHFWALIFLYIWAGPHHLLNTALPDWAQTLGMVFSVALWAPSWGGMINGLLTLRGAWDKLRTDPVVKFFVAGITFYGMSTFEGPLLSIKSVNALAHDTDWIISHVHGGALGWNGFMAAGMFYWLVPKLYGTKLRSEKWANFHFWIGLFGILLYMAAMYVSGLTQGLMWRALRPDGGLMYPNFLESVLASINMYYIRAFAGTLYLSGFILMAVNLFKTARLGQAVDGETTVLIKDAETGAPWWKLIISPVIGLVLFGLIVLLAFGLTDPLQIVAAYIGVAVVLVAAVLMIKQKSGTINGKSWHEILEGKAFVFSVFVLLSILVGGVVQILPAVLTDKGVPLVRHPVPYTPLELAGRDLYRREGCYNCHTQMVRPLVAETLRYGPYSEAWESEYDHPFQWGSKRTGPDLQRVGGKYPDLWHYRHMINPRATSPGSIMPDYSFLARAELDFTDLPAKMAIMKTLGVPYSDDQIKNGAVDAEAQANKIVAGLKENGETIAPNRELVAMIAYLQRLGTDNKAK